MFDGRLGRDLDVVNTDAMLVVGNVKQTQFNNP